MFESLIALVLLSPLVIAIVFLVKLVQVTGKVKKLEEQMGQILARSAPDGSGVSATRSAVPKAAAAEATPPPVPHQAATVQEAEKQAVPPGQSTYSPAAEAKQPAHAHATRSTAGLSGGKTEPAAKRSRGEWESIIGGKWLNRIGAFALIIAMGFFLKYAFDNDLINETMRVGIGAAIGLALVVGGWWAERKDLRVFAQGLVGAGISTLYISVYASFNFYQLLPQIPAFGLMSAVTALTLYQAFRYDSIAVATLGLLGGFLTPFFLSTGSVNTVGLFTYIVLLDAGLLAIVLYKDRWAILDILTLIGTYAVYFVWYDSAYEAGEAFTALGFLAAFWGLFFVVEFVRMWRDSTTWNALRQSTFALSAILFYGAAYAILDSDIEHLTALFTLGLGLAYLGAAVVASLRGVDRSATSIRSTVTGALLVAMAITIQYENEPVISLIAAEAMLFAVAGWALRLPHVRVTGLALLGIAYFCMFYVPGAAGMGMYSLADFAPVFNLRTVAWMALAGGAAFMAWLESPHRLPSGYGPDDEGGSFPYVSDALHAGWALAVFILVSVEVSDAFVRAMTGLTPAAKHILRFQQALTVTLTTALFATALTWLGARRGLVSVRVTGISLMWVAALSAVLLGWRFVPIEAFTPGLNIRMAVMLAVTVALLLHAFIVQRAFAGRDWQKALSGAFQVAASLLLLFLLTSEVLDFYRAKIHAVHASGLAGSALSDALRPLENMQQLALSIAWLVFSIALMVYGFLRNSPIQRIVAFAVFGISILKIFIYDLQFLDTLYRIFSFIGLGIILLVVSYLYTRYKDVIVGKDAPETES